MLWVLDAHAGLTRKWQAKESEQRSAHPPSATATSHLRRLQAIRRRRTCKEKPHICEGIPYMSGRTFTWASPGPRYWGVREHSESCTFDQVGSMEPSHPKTIS